MELGNIEGAPGQQTVTMGQARSRYERPGGFWHRHKVQAAVRNSSTEHPNKMSPPTPEPDQSSVQMDQSSALADPSSTTADTTPPIAAPHPDKHGDAMAETEQQPSAPTDHPMADAPDESDKPDEPDDSKPTKPAEAPAPSRSPAPSGFTPSGFTPSGFVPSRSTPSRPAFEREFTPPHLINIWSRSAWQTEHAYSNVHDHVTRTLNQARRFQGYTHPPWLLFDLGADN